MVSGEERERERRSQMRCWCLCWCLLCCVQLVCCKKSSGSLTFEAPAVSFRWRSRRTEKQWDKVNFPVDFPLSEELIRRGMPKLTPEELHRFLPLVTLLSEEQRGREAARQSGVSERGRNVTVVSLGGSFALGTQCCVGSSWPNRFVEWLQMAYPLVTFNHIEFLKGSTNSLYGASVVRELFDQIHVDILLLGYALNDEVRFSICVVACHCFNCYC